MLFSPQILSRGNSAKNFPAPNITGMIGWWDASIPASFTLSGSDIISVADQSGNSQTMNWVGANKPSYGATSFNTSHPGMSFTGSSVTALECASFIMGTGNTLTFWYVGTELGSGSNGFARFFSYATPGVHDDWNYAGSWSVNNTNPPDGTLIQFQRNTALVQATGITAYPAGHRIIGTIDSGGTLTLYVDGVSVGTVSSPGNWVTGGTIGLGRNGFGSFNYSTIIVGELGVATGFTNSTDVASLDAHLRAKWAL